MAQRSRRTQAFGTYVDGAAESGVGTPHCGRASISQRTQRDGDHLRRSGGSGSCLYHKLAPVAERAATARAFATALLGVRLTLHPDKRNTALCAGHWEAGKDGKNLTDEVMLGCILALQNALNMLEKTEQSDEALATPTDQVFPSWEGRVKGALRLGLLQAAASSACTTPPSFSNWAIPTGQRWR